jgi:hypothetical protein
MIVIIVIAAFVFGVLVGMSSWLVAAAWLEAHCRRSNEERECGSTTAKEAPRINDPSLKRAL